MATALGDGEENKSLVMNCNLCKDASKKPKLLPCQHSCCTQCLAQHHDTLDEGKPPDCPICQTVYKVDDDTVESLPDNYLYDIVKEAYGGENSQEMKCISCSQVEKVTNASHKCLDCGDTLCQHCNEWHCRTTMTKHHVVVPVGDLKEGKFKQEFSTRKVLYCSLHSTDEKKIPLSSYCKDCSCLVCVTCIQGEHQSHAVTELHIAKEEKQVQFKNNFRKLQRSKRDQQKRVTSIENSITKTEQKWNEQEREIYDKATEMYTLIEKIKEEKLAELKEHYEKEIQCLTELLNEERCKQSSIQATAALSSEFLEHSSDSDFLCHEKDVKTRMESSQRRKLDGYQKSDLDIVKQDVNELLPVLKRVFGIFIPIKRMMKHEYKIGKVSKTLSQTVEIKHVYGIAFNDATKELLLSGGGGEQSILVLSDNSQMKRYIPCENGGYAYAVHVQGHDIYVTFYLKEIRQLVIIDANGKIKNRFMLPDDDQDGQSTVAMVVAEDNTVYIASGHTGRIYKMNPNENTLSQLLPKAYGPRLNGQLHVCLTPSDQLVVLSPPTISLYSKDGELSSQRGAKEEENALIKPCGVCCDEYGCIYVSDNENCRIQVFRDMELIGNIPIDEQAKEFSFIPLLLTPERDLVYGYGSTLVKIAFWEWGDIMIQ